MVNDGNLSWSNPPLRFVPYINLYIPPLPPSLCVAVEQPRHILGRRSSGGLSAQHGQPVPDADRRSFRLRKPPKDIEKSFIMNLILGFYMISYHIFTRLIRCLPYFAILYHMFTIIYHISNRVCHRNCTTPPTHRIPRLAPAWRLADPTASSARKSSRAWVASRWSPAECSDPRLIVSTLSLTNGW